MKETLSAAEKIPFTERMLYGGGYMALLIFAVMALFPLNPVLKFMPPPASMLETVAGVLIWLCLFLYLLRFFGLMLLNIVLNRVDKITGTITQTSSVHRNAQLKIMLADGKSYNLPLLYYRKIQHLSHKLKPGAKITFFCLRGFQTIIRMDTDF